MSPFAHKLIVVPVDLSDFSTVALDFALQLASQPSDVRSLHVGLPAAAVDPPYSALMDDAARRRDVEKAVHEHYAGYERKGAQSEVRYGDPSDQIARYAAEIGAGLIVMSSHGRTGLRHLLIGSVAERVVRHAACPVLVLRGVGQVKNGEVD